MRARRSQRHARASVSWRVVALGVLVAILAAALAWANQKAGGPERLARIGRLKLAEALPGAAPPPRRLADTAENFADRIGVVVHLVYSDSSYAQWPEVLGALRYLGVTRLREWAPLPTNANIETVHAAADAGYRFDFLVYGESPLDQSLAAIVAFDRRHPGKVAAIEGPNEINNFPFAYRGLDGDDAGQAFQADLFQAVRKRHELRAIPVYNLTSWPDLAGAADFGNFHSYPGEGGQAKSTLLADMAHQKAVMPGKPMVLTEAGYHNTIGAGLWEGVDEQTAAPLMLDMLLDAWSAGVSDIYIYQLLDAYPDPEGKDMERHFGLFDIRYRPKPAATALRNLLLALREQGPAGPQLAAAVIDRGPDDLASLQLARADGARVAILYRRATLWDAEVHAPRIVVPEEVMIEAPARARSVTIRDPVTGTLTRRAVSSARFAIPLGTNPLMLVFRP